MAEIPQSDIEQKIVDRMVRFRHDPHGCALYSLPWGEGELKDSQGPRTWQAGIMRYIGDHLSNPKTRFQPCQIAVSSGHGIGKSALVSMLIHWGLSTARDTKILVTANTATQLDTKTVPEVAKWFRLALNAHWFDVKATAIKLKGKDDSAAKVWRADFTPWSEHNTDAFQGLHNKDKRVMLIFDEASGIADRVWEVASGAMSDADTEIIWLAFGNPIHNTGRFRECFGRFAHRWKHFQIDSRTVEGTNKEQIAKDVADWGEDSDFVRMRWRGEFPRAGSNQFIASDVVAACRKYEATGYDDFPKILGVDVARFGDDQTVLVLRQGRKSEILGKFRGLDTAQVTSKVIEAINAKKIDAVIVDSDGIGAPVFDQLKFQGYGKNLHEFHGGKPAFNGKMYFNRRAEVWGLMRDWLNAGAQIPDDPEIETDLTGPEYGFSPQQQVQLEKKDDMKARGLSSPDVGDALAMSFAVNLLAKPKQAIKPQVYDPLTLQHSWMG